MSPRLSHRRPLARDIDVGVRHPRPLTYLPNLVADSAQDAVSATDPREGFDEAIDLRVRMTRAHAQPQNGVPFWDSGEAHRSDLEPSLEELATQGVEEPLVADATRVPSATPSA